MGTFDQELPKRLDASHKLLIEFLTERIHKEIPSSDSSDSSRKVSKRRHRKIVTNVSDASKTLPENNKTRKRQRVDKNNNTEVSGKRTKANGEKRQVRKSRWTPSQQSILEEYFE
ncbi:unnamed protein product, partial [Anisakis simplex]|uniref:Homeobox domain-containing protein n=1 Tax=Anisakis simplex TaxID=6269 RepID=A0A0M3JA11_ANISI